MSFVHRSSALARPARWLAAIGAALVFAGASEARADNAACVKAFERGTAARERGGLRDARRHFAACAADACAKPLRMDCVKLLEDVDDSLPTVVFGAKDARGADLFAVDVFVDGERVVGHEEGKAVPVDPGPHVVRFEHEGREPVEEKVLLRAGERNRHVIAKFGAEIPSTRRAVEPAAPAKKTTVVPTSAVVLGGIGLGAIGGFVFFGLTGSQERDRLGARCAPGCTDADVSSLKTSYIAADVSLAVGIVALGVATYLFLTNDGTKAARR